jgi:LAS superfamily LD-carboxypeptidase LdcB
MRVIDPKSFKARPSKRKRRNILPVLLLVLVVLGVFVYFQIFSNSDAEQQQEIVNAEKAAQSEAQPETSTSDKKPISEFTGNEFRLLYDNLMLENTEKIDKPPVITGNDVADARIRQIAETRGYKLRVEASTLLPVVGNFRLQESLREPWVDLRRAIIDETGINMSIVSGYRTIEEQRQLFVSRLNARGVNINDVAQGIADEQVNAVLIESSIPGYSKHHSGYTIDLFCPGWVFEDFKSSDCHTWLVANNYENARRFGFIPSYPVDADLQGPDPEAWEYVFVGLDALTVAQ